MPTTRRSFLKGLAALVPAAAISRQSAAAPTPPPVLDEDHGPAPRHRPAGKRFDIYYHVDSVGTWTVKSHPWLKGCYVVRCERNTKHLFPRKIWAENIVEHYDAPSATKAYEIARPGIEIKLARMEPLFDE